MHVHLQYLPIPFFERLQLHADNPTPKLWSRIGTYMRSG